MIETKIVSRFTTLLAKIFGKKEEYENEYFFVTVHEWLNKLYITDIHAK